MRWACRVRHRRDKKYVHNLVEEFAGKNLIERYPDMDTGKTLKCISDM
jgi:hypothetical protein